MTELELWAFTIVLLAVALLILVDVLGDLFPRLSWRQRAVVVLQAYAALGCIRLAFIVGAVGTVKGLS